MNWASIAPLVAQFAPTLGSLLGSMLPIPFGGTIGQKAGEMLAAALGVPPTPAAVASAIQSNPDEQLRIKLHQVEVAVMADADVQKALFAAQVQNAEAVNQTMRAELAANVGWFRTYWRPTAGWLFDAVIVLWVIMITVAVVLAANGNDKMVEAILKVQIVAAFLLTALGAVVGVAVFSRTRDKETSATLIAAVGAPPPASPPVRR